MKLLSLLEGSLTVLPLLSYYYVATEACSDILVTPGASEDGSAMIAYNADDVSLYGVLYHYPAAHGKEGESRSIYEWDTGVSSKIYKANRISGVSKDISAEPVILLNLFVTFACSSNLMPLFISIVFPLVEILG